MLPAPPSPCETRWGEVACHAKRGVVAVVATLVTPFGADVVDAALPRYFRYEARDPMSECRSGVASPAAAAAAAARAPCILPVSLGQQRGRRRPNEVVKR